MAPRHDEIVKTTGDGFFVAWDTTTRSDTARTKAVDEVVVEQARELGEIIGADIVMRHSDEVIAVEIKTSKRAPRSTARLRTR
jgi:hypothetical protein